MKGNIKKSAVFVVVAIIAMFTVVSMASAGPKVKVTGVFAGPSTEECLVTTSTAGPNGNGFIEVGSETSPGTLKGFQLYLPTSPGSQYWDAFSTSNAIVTFYSNGTVTREGHSHTLNIGASVPTSGASDWSSTAPSSGVHPGKSFTTSYPIEGTILTGVWKGVTFSVDKIHLDGWFSKDGKTISFFSVGPEVETETYTCKNTSSFTCPAYFPEGHVVTYHRICPRSSTVFKIDQHTED